MARVETIIVGGGINPGSPFTLNGIPYVSQVSPPLAATTDFLSVVPTGTTRAVIIGSADPQATATERLRMNGGMISEGGAADTFIGGRLAAAGGARSIAIGLSVIVGVAADVVAIGNTIAATTGAGGVYIGNNLSHNAGQANDVIIGNALSTGTGSGVAIGGSLTGGGSAKSVCIGGSITAGNGNNTAIGGTVSGGNTGHVALGQGATTSTTAASIAIGSVSITGSGSSVGINPSAIASVATLSASQCVAIGFGFSITHADVLAFGRCTSFQTNTVQFGGTFGVMNTMLIGSDNQVAAAVPVTIRLSNGSGTDNVAGALTLQAGLSTGAGASPAINLNVGVVAGSSGTVQTSRTGVRCSFSATAADTYLMVFDVDTATLSRVSVGAAGSGGVGFKVLRIPN